MKKAASLKNLFVEIKGDGGRVPAWPVAFWLGVAVLATGQDALFSVLKNTSFYWSESLLYKVYWLLFIPLTVIVSGVARRFPIGEVFSRNSLKHILLAVLTSLVQVLVFSALVAVLSEILLGYPFHFAGVLRKSLAEDFFTGLLMYGLLLVLAHRFSATDTGPRSSGIAKDMTKVQAPADFLNVFLVKDGARIQRIPVETIDWIGSEDSYTVLHRGNQKWLYLESLSKLEKQLDPADFIRIHRSSIVNIHRVQKITSRLTGDYDVGLNDGTLLRLSRYYVQKTKGRLL